MERCQLIKKHFRLTAGVLYHDDSNTEVTVKHLGVIMDSDFKIGEQFSGQVQFLLVDTKAESF